MTYHNAIKYLQQAPKESSDSQALTLLWEALDAPQRSLKYLRFTGSSGKSACAALLISAFRNSEHVVGSLSLPFQNDGKYNILINAETLPSEHFTSYVKQIVYAIKKINLERNNEIAEKESTQEVAPMVLSQSELLLSVALLAFREHRCSFCLIESEASPNDPTRRLPSPFAAAICGTIPSEHQKELQQIRSYIVHGIREIISAPQDQIAYRLISETCAAVNCRLTIPTKSELNIARLSLSGSEFSYKNKNYKLGLCGKFQITNATVVLETINMLSRYGYTLSTEQISNGLLTTKIPARFEIISVSPTIIVDSTHSESAVSVVCDALSDFSAILGDRLRLCLPFGDLSKQYAVALTSCGYTVESTFLYDSGTGTKELVSAFFQTLSKNDVLLISGHYDKTVKIREELLKQLQK